MSVFKKIVICGGTHGNELTGAYLAKKHNWFLANPAAVAAGRRYVDCDLNRCFALSALNNFLLSEGCPKGRVSDLPNEQKRAIEINNLFGGKGTENAPDLIIDIHNTTANMGVTIILNEEHPILMAASAIIANEFSDVYIYMQIEERNESPYLGTIAKHDICIEAGPQPHGTLNADLFFKVEKIIFRLLELIKNMDDAVGADPCVCPVENIFTETGYIDFPRDAEGNIGAMIHPDLQGKDYRELKPGMPAFMDFNGKEILWEGEVCYPVFINEAAYYEKGIAMYLANLVNV